MLIGACGSLRIPQIVQHVMHQPSHPKNMGTMKYLVGTWVPALRKCLVESSFIPKEPSGDGDKVMPESGLLLGYRGGLFVVESDGNVGERVVPYNAIGSGASHALAALCQQEMLLDDRHPEVRVRDALAIAAAHVCNVTAPFTVISTVKDQ